MEKAEVEDKVEASRGVFSRRASELARAAEECPKGLALDLWAATINCRSLEDLGWSQPQPCLGAAWDQPQPGPA
jgi:hypothetical protein